jgi:hypothetical protein
MLGVAYDGIVRVVCVPLVAVTHDLQGASESAASHR